MSEQIRHIDIYEPDIMDGFVKEVLSGIQILDSLEKKTLEVSKVINTSLKSANVGNFEGIKSIAQNQKLANDTFVESEKILKDKIKLEKQLNDALTEQAKEIANLKVLLQEQNRLNKENARATNDQMGAYTNASARLNQMRKQWKDLAVAQRENTTEAKLLKKEMQDLDTLLKKVDADAGQHQRNVGNYAGSFNGLQNSINQVTRELPAFTNSLQTGFMGISNNIPMLVDQMNALSRANKEMAANGEKTIPVWKQMLKGIFSWQSALSVGITLLTVYGAEIVTWIGGLFGVVDATEKAAKAQENLNKELDYTVKRIKALATSQLDEIEHNTALLVIAAKKRHATNEEIRKIEEQGREKSILKLQDELERITALWSAANDDINKAKEAVRLKDNENTRKVLDETIKREEKLQDEREAIQTEIENRQRANIRILRQLELDDQLEREKNAKLAAEKQAKINEKGLAELEKLRNKAWEEERLALLTQEDEKLKLINPNKQEKELREWLDKKRKMEELARKEEAQRMKDSVALLQTITNDRNAIRMREIDRDIENSKRRENELQNIALQGSEDAKNNIAFERRRQAELERERRRQIEAQKRSELGIAVLKSYASNVEKNPEGALGKTLTDISVLTGAIRALPTFEKGTENTGEKGYGIDGKGGFHAILHPNERVMTKDQNRKVGELSNDELADIANMYNMGILDFDRYSQGKSHFDDGKLNRLNDNVEQLIDIVKSRPVQSIDIDVLRKVFTLNETSGKGVTKKTGLFK